MKLKYIIILACLGVAFSAASLWVILSGGRNAKAVRAKFRLGGLMLSISSMLALASCEGGGSGILSPDCYDPIPPEIVEYITFGQGEFSAGDRIELKVVEAWPDKCDTLRCEIRGKSAELIQSEDFKYTPCDVVSFTIAETDYRGSAFLNTGFVKDGEFFAMDTRGILLK